MEINCETEPLVLSGSQIVFDVDKIDEKVIDKYLETLSETQSQNSEEPKNTCKLKVSNINFYRILIQTVNILTLRRPGRQAWQSGLFYGLLALTCKFQVISKRRRMTPLEI